MSYPFNVRVYGILVEKEKILLSDEYFNKKFIAKFPGGGLQFGEGTIDCIKREFMEELSLKVDVISHFYTTDFFQVSAFDNQKQIISIYYLVKSIEGIKIKTSVKKFDFPELINECQSFRWIGLSDIKENEMTFPIDKKVTGLLKEKFLK